MAPCDSQVVVQSLESPCDLLGGTVGLLGFLGGDGDLGNSLALRWHHLGTCYIVLSQCIKNNRSKSISLSPINSQAGRGMMYLDQITILADSFPLRIRQCYEQRQPLWMQSHRPLDRGEVLLAENSASCCSLVPQKQTLRQVQVEVTPGNISEEGAWGRKARKHRQWIKRAL